MASQPQPPHERSSCVPPAPSWTRSALSGPLWRARAPRAAPAPPAPKTPRIEWGICIGSSQDELRLYSSYDSTSSTAYMVIIYCKFGKSSQSFRLLAQWLVHYMQWWKVTRTSPGWLPGYFFCCFLHQNPTVFWLPASHAIFLGLPNSHYSHATREGSASIGSQFPVGSHDVA